MAIHTWKYGSDSIDDNAPAEAYAGTGVAAGDTDFRGKRLYLTPGTRSITALGANVGLSYAPANVDRTILFIAKDNAGDLDIEYIWSIGFDDTGLGRPSNVNELTWTFSTPLQFTIPDDGADRYLCLGFELTNTDEVWHRYDTSWDTGEISGRVNQHDLTNVDTIVAADFSAQTNSSRFNITYTSDRYIEASLGAYSGTTTRYYIPEYLRTSDDVSTIIFQSARAADPNSLTIELFESDINGIPLEHSTTLLDSGDTATNITVDGVVQYLEDVGANDQEGSYFDIAVQMASGTTNELDVLYTNKSYPAINSAIATISHAAKNGSAHGTKYSKTFPDEMMSYLRISGTADIDNIYVCAPYGVAVCVGDSQVASSYANGGSPSGLLDRTHRMVQQLFAESTNERFQWIGGESGNRSDQIASRYNASTAGEGDLIDFRDVVMLLAGVGLNDISQTSLTSNAQAEAEANTILGRYQTMASDAVSNGNTPWVLGLPPYSAVAADQYEAYAIKYLDTVLLKAFAEDNNYAGYGFWERAVVSGTEDDLIPEFDSAYTNDAGTHWSTNEETDLSALAAAAIIILEAGQQSWPLNTRQQFPFSSFLKGITGPFEEPDPPILVLNGVDQRSVITKNSDISYEASDVIQVSSGQEILLETIYEDVEIRYTFDGKPPSKFSEKYDGSITLYNNDAGDYIVLKARSYPVDNPSTYTFYGSAVKCPVATWYIKVV